MIETEEERRDTRLFDSEEKKSWSRVEIRQHRNRTRCSHYPFKQSRAKAQKEQIVLKTKRKAEKEDGRARKTKEGRVSV